MKSSISYLPESKQKELKKLTSVICKNCSDIEKIILFGSYARGNYKEEKDLLPDRKSGHVSDYDILVVTEKKEVALDTMLWQRIKKECKNLNLSAYPKLLTHDIEALNIKLAEAQYFYSDVKKEGILLFDAGKFELADARELTAEELRKIAQNNFDEWFGSALDFFTDHNNALFRGSLKRSAFYLHQVAESCYKTILLVFSNYCPNEHFLAILGFRAEKYSDSLKNLFPEKTVEEQERLRLLEYAYIGGRYDPNYRIKKEDLEILATYVKQLLEITERICKEKIESF
jgi:predicted nucleotidyltransferase/HEPN domain-containing protein